MFNRSKNNVLSETSKDEGASSLNGISNKKIILLGLVGIVLATGVSYGVTDIILNRKIEAKKLELEQEAQSYISAEESKDVVSTVTDAELEAKGALTITATTDKIGQELVEPSDELSFKNDSDWYLVDTDGDFKGDTYWNITKDDAVNGVYGKMYLYSNTKRRYKQVLVQKEDKARGIKEKWESVLDMEQVIPPQFLLPAQYYNKDRGTVLDWSVDK